MQLFQDSERPSWFLALSALKCQFIDDRGSHLVGHLPVDGVDMAEAYQVVAGSVIRYDGLDLGRAQARFDSCARAFSDCALRIRVHLPPNGFQVRETGHLPAGIVAGQDNSNRCLALVGACAGAADSIALDLEVMNAYGMPLPIFQLATHRQIEVAFLLEPGQLIAVRRYQGRSLLPDVDIWRWHRGAMKPLRMRRDRAKLEAQSQAQLYWRPV